MLALDLSFPRFDRPRFDRAVEVTALPADLAVLMVGVAARQAASPTAVTLARAGARSEARFVLASFDTRLLAPLDGAFNGPMAAALTRWRDE